jgi:hypothetical protein
MREYYECMFGDALLDATLYETPPVDDQDDQSRLLPVPNSSGEQRAVRSYKRSCEFREIQHSCAVAEEVMAKELDRALASPVGHEAGALVACSPK